MANLGRLAIAMLGILAYQNRDKIGDAIRGVGKGTDPNDPQGGLLDQLSEGVSGTALGDVLDRFRNSGAGSKVDSWVRKVRTTLSKHRKSSQPLMRKLFPRSRNRRGSHAKN